MDEPNSKPGIVLHTGGILCLATLTGILPYPFGDSRLVAFLDAVHERILLRRVNGGWIFIHRSLLEYFAELSDSARQPAE